MMFLCCCSGRRLRRAHFDCIHRIAESISLKCQSGRLAPDEKIVIPTERPGFFLRSVCERRAASLTFLLRPSLRHAPSGIQRTPAQAYRWTLYRLDNPRCRRSLCLCRRVSTPTQQRCRRGRRAALRHLCPDRESCRRPSEEALFREALLLFLEGEPCLLDLAHTRPSSLGCSRHRGSRRSS